MTLKTFVRCTECNWDGEDWDTVETAKHSQACPECFGDTVKGSWCITCRDVAVDDPGYEECPACSEKGEAAFNTRVERLQKAIRTHNEYKKTLKDPTQSARANQLRHELRGLLDMDGAA